MAAPIRVTFVGDDAGLQAAAARSEAALARFAGSAEEAAKVAAKAAADQARAAGASASEQEAAAARAAAAVVESSARMTEAQKAAAKGAIAFAKAQGAAADEQVAAARRAIAAQKALEAQSAVAADAAKAAAAKTAAAAEASAARVAAAQKRLSSIGKWTLFGGVAGIAASVKGAADLSQSMERLQTQAGASTGQVAKLTSGVMSMAGKVGDSPDQLAQGLYHVVSNLNKSIAPAQRVTAELSALKVAAEGARVGGSDLVDTTNALGGAIRSGIAGTQNYQRAMGALNATVGAGDMSMQNLAEALGTGLLGPMKTYGVSLKDISSALAVFGDNNIKGADAGTKLGSAVRIMAASSPTASKALKAIGMTQFQMANDLRSPAGLVGALKDLQQHLNAATGAPAVWEKTAHGMKAANQAASEQALIIERAFGGKQSTGVQLLLGQLGVLKDAEKQVGAGANQFGSAWGHQNQQFSQQVADLKATIQSLADRFGTTLIPILKAAGTDLGDIITWFSKNKAAAEALGIMIATGLGLAVSVFVGEKVVAFVKGLQAMGTGAAKLAGGIASTASKIGDSLSGVSSVSGATASKVAADDAAMEASNSATGASFGAVSTEAGAAGATLEGEWAGTAAAVEGTNGAIEASNAAVAASFGAVATAAGAAAAAALVLKGDSNMPTYAKHPPGMPQINAPQAGESRLAYIKASLGLPSGYKGGRITAGSYKGPNEDHKTIDAFFKWLAGAGTFASGGFTPKPTGGGGLNLSQSALRAAQTHLGGFSSTEKTNAAAVMQQLMAGGLSPAGAAAVAGNWVQESGLNPSEPGGLLAQWGGSRLTGEMAFAKAQGLPYNSTAAETGFALQELKAYPSLEAALKSGKLGPQQLALMVSQQYERPLASAANNPHREAAAQEIFSAFGGVASPGTPFTPSSFASTPSAALLKYLGGTTGSSKSKVPLSTGSVTTTIDNTISRYKGLEKSASSGLIAGLYRGFVSHLQALAPKFEDEAKNAKSSAGLTKVRQALSETLTSMESGLAANVKNFTRAESVANAIVAATVKLHQGYAKTGTSLITKYDNGAQSGTARTLENALGFKATGRFLPNGGLGMTGAERLSELADHRGIGGLIEGGTSARSLGSTIGRLTKGSPQNQSYLGAVQNLIQSGQTKEADKLVAAHKAAMAALANTLIADQRTKDGQELAQQATALKDQTTATQNATQAAQQIWQTSEQKINDMAAGVLQSMQDAQQVINDTMSGVAQAIKDQTAVNTDQSSAVVDAINDQTQIQVDKIGEKGLYGLNLIAQQDKVAADQVKAYWDQQIDAAQKQLDIDQQQANAAENAAQIALDNVTATEHVAVNQAQTSLDTVENQQAIKVAAAQAHADAVQTAADVTLIGPAQIAVDMNATASKSTQAVMAANLTKAQGQADNRTAAALKQLVVAQSDSQLAIQGAQNAYDQTNNAAQQAILGAQNAVSNMTNYWNNVIAGAQGTVASTTGSANQAEASANSTTSLAQALASTQFAGSAATINIYGADLSNAAGLTEAVSWGIRSAGLAS